MPVSIMEIDVGLIAGTCTRGRQNGFSTDLMPLSDPSSELVMKWNDPIGVQRSEGIR